MRRAALGVLGVWALAACDPDPPAMGETGGTDSDTDVGSTSGATTEGGTGSSDGGPVDSSESGATTTAPTVTCDAPLLDETFEIDPGGANGQIQPGVVFDAQAGGVWVTYNAPSADGSGKFDVFVARLGCDGAPQIEPLLVNQTAGSNNIDPDLARIGDDILVTWSADDGSGGDSNLSILLQSLGPDGAPLWPEDRALVTTLDDAPFSASAWMPRLVAANADFAIVGTRAIEAASAFQVFVQRVDSEGDALGGTAALASMPGVAHDTPHVAADEAGALVAAWVRTEDFELRQVEFASAIDGAFDPEVATRLLEGNATGPSVAMGPDGPLIAVSETQGAGARIRVSATQADATPMHAGEDGGLHHTPVLVATTGGAALSWYRNLGGLSNEVLVARVDVEAGALVVGEPEVVPDAVAAPYATTMTHVGGGVVFVAWAQGDSPNFRVYGRFMAP
ncbi:MAG: hypothetical protein AAF721_05410 [Myxococcota bacterium]